MKVCDILKSRRIAGEFIQKDIAKATGTSVPYVCKLERGGFLPSPKYLILFCNKTNSNYELIVGTLLDERMDSLREILDKKYEKYISKKAILYRR